MATTIVNKTIKLAQERPTYSQSDLVKRLQSNLESAEASRPSSYVSPYKTQIDSNLNSILNREKFSYNANLDPLYQQYKNLYVKNGQNAMRDTMAQAAELTGGYGNSYATSAAQQAYDASLGNLNDKLLDLYNIAYNRYKDEGAQARDNLSLLQNADATDYGRYRDTVSDYMNDRAYALDRYNNERNFDYGTYQDEVDMWKYLESIAEEEKSGGRGNGGGGNNNNNNNNNNTGFVPTRGNDLDTTGNITSSDANSGLRKVASTIESMSNLSKDTSEMTRYVDDALSRGLITKSQANDVKKAINQSV